MIERGRCSRCDAYLSGNAPYGLCPKCLIKVGLEADVDDTLEGPALIDSPGTIIDQYELLQLIGEGGMGLVYLAEQKKPVRRQVALKVIKPGMDSNRVIARFEAERQALALLDHPNMAHVFDAGTTETGRPYFVMEYVKGLSITEHCDRRRLSIEERLNLFLEVCDAVQYAHQKGIIHRDIKPSNILVSERGDKAVPQIIDFGVAKAISQPLTERPLYTEQGQLLGTPEYMSPEQIDMKMQDIDTRSDIYSLGVVLYVLLTGVLPFDPQTLREGGIDGIRKVIREEEPKTPSTRLSTLSEEESTKVARERHIDFATLQRRLHGDLDWITLKAMEKDRVCRYDSVSELATDIQRHLTHEPISARPRSTTYRFRKFVRRNRVMVTAATVVVLTLAIGLVVSTTMYLQKRHTLDALVKLEAEVEADRNLSTVQKLYAEGQYQAALSEIEKYLQRKEAGPKARLLYANLLFDLDRFDEATAESKSLLAGLPEIAGAAHFLLARIYMGSDPNEADEHQRAGEALLPRTAEGYCLRGMTASTAESTIQWLSRALELDPSHYPSRKARALAYYAIRDYAGMAHDVEAIIVMRPKDSLGYALRAIVQRETGRFDEAIEDHSRAIATCDIEAELAELYDQRRETYLHMVNYEAALMDATRSMELEPNEFCYKFHVFTALVSLGKYEAAKELYKQIVADDAGHSWQFAIRAVRHVFKVLGMGQSFELPEEIASEAPFSAMREAAGHYRKINDKATRLVTSVFGQSSWSPDGRQLAYGRTDQYAWRAKPLTTGTPAIYGSSGIEIMDLETARIRLVVSSGKDPAWSPDGRYIAFVREPYRRRDYKEEVWLIAVEDGEPRRLAPGGWPIWASDSKRLFFHSREKNALFCMAVDEPNARPKQIMPCPGLFPGISSDEKYVAYAVGNELQIAEMDTGSVIDRWIAPSQESGMIVRWSPDGKEILVTGFHFSNLGLWSYDVERKKAWQLFETPAMSANLTSDRSEMSVQLRTPYGELWLATLDPQAPIYKSVRSTLTQTEFMQRKHEQYAQYVKSGQLDPGMLEDLKAGLNSVGINQYDHANYEEALWTFTEVDKLRHVLGETSHPSDIAFMAMSLFHLGRHTEAQASIDKLRRLFDGGEYAGHEEYLYEAERLFAGEDGKVSQAWKYIGAGNLEEALRITEQITSLPYDGNAEIAGEVQSLIRILASAYHNRAKSTGSRKGGYDETIADYETSLKIDRDNSLALNELGWLRATCPSAEFRDGTAAVKYATKACELTSWQNAININTLAAACAEDGDFDSAVKWQRQAIALLPDGKSPTLQPGYELRLRLYESGKPYHKGLIARWQFDRSEAGSVIDSSGNGIDGRLMGDAHTVLSGERGSVLSIDGDGDYIDCGNNSLFNIADEITVVFWMKAEPSQCFQSTMLSKGDQAWRITLFHDENYIEFACSGTSGQWFTGGKNVKDGQWHSVTGVYDGSKMYIYVDGALDGSKHSTGLINVTDDPLWIGGNSDYGISRCFNGSLDDIRIYDYALSQAEIRTQKLSTVELNDTVQDK